MLEKDSSLCVLKEAEGGYIQCKGETQRMTINWDNLMPFLDPKFLLLVISSKLRGDPFRFFYSQADIYLEVAMLA